MISKSIYNERDIERTLPDINKRKVHKENCLNGKQILIFTRICICMILVDYYPI